MSGLPSWWNRFWSKVRIPNDEDGCWIWHGAMDGYRAYGRFTWQGTTHQAHRWIYEHAVDIIPDGHVVDHTCHQTLCVRPSHLRTLTMGDNSRARQPKRGVRPKVQCTGCGAIMALTATRHHFCEEQSA